MEEFDPSAIGSWRPDSLTSDEFTARHEAMRALITDATTSGDSVMHSIMTEALEDLEHNNPNAVYRLLSSK